MPVRQGKFTIGLLKGKLSGQGPDFFAPMTEAELEQWEGGQ